MCCIKAGFARSQGNEDFVHGLLGCAASHPGDEQAGVCFLFRWERPQVYIKTAVRKWLRLHEDGDAEPGVDISISSGSLKAFVRLLKLP